MSNIEKIEPDNIKDSVVEVRYESQLPHELIIGIIYKKLSDNFTLIKTESGSKPIKLQGKSEVIELSLDKRNETLLHDDEISLKLSPNAIVFNCLNKYLLWPKYFDKISNVLSEIYEEEIITSVARIGIRYINEYIDVKIEDIVKFEFKFGIPDVKSNKFTFRTEFDFENHLIILNLIKTTATTKTETQPKEIQVCYVDIDVIKQNVNIKDKDNLISVIDEAHSIEKELFFNKLLKNEYLKTLKIKRSE